MSDLEISVVIPLLNEEGSLKQLHAQLTEVLSGLGCSYEILFINDGSTDGSAEIIDALAAEDPHIGLIHFRRNFGKAAGLNAGFKMARGKIIFTMDADLQDDPAEIPRFLEELEEGYDLVSGWKKKRHDPLGKTLPSKLFNFVVRRASGLQLDDFNCGFKAYRAETVQELNLYGELHRYVPVLVHWQGFRVGQMAVKHHPRRFGSSKYGVERMAKGFFDLLTVLLNTRYNSRPLHLFGFVGLMMSLLGAGILGYLSLLWVLDYGPIGNRPLLLFGLLLVLFGGQLISTGLLGELINRSQQADRPVYSIREQHKPGES